MEDFWLVFLIQCFLDSCCLFGSCSVFLLCMWSLERLNWSRGNIPFNHFFPFQSSFILLWLSPILSATPNVFLFLAFRLDMSGPISLFAECPFWQQLRVHQTAFTSQSNWLTTMKYLSERNLKRWDGVLFIFSVKIKNSSRKLQLRLKLLITSKLFDPWKTWTCVLNWHWSSRFYSFYFYFSVFSPLWRHSVCFHRGVKKE